MFCYVTRYFRIYNLEAFFNFPLTFLQLYVTKMFTVHAGAPDNSNIFRYCLEGSSYRESTVDTFVLNASTLK